MILFIMGYAMILFAEKNTKQFPNLKLFWIILFSIPLVDLVLLGVIMFWFNVSLLIEFEILEFLDEKEF